MKLINIFLLTSISTTALADVGILEIYTNADSWSVFVDDKKKLTTSRSHNSFLELNEGEHNISFTLDYDNYLEYKKSYEVYIGGRTNQGMRVDLLTHSLLNLPVAKKEVYLSNKKMMRSQGLIDNNDGTITDSKSGLTWKKCIEGQEFKGNECVGNIALYSWDDAVKTAKSFAGRNDWRLPTANELHTLVFCTNSRSPITRDENGNNVKIDGAWQDGSCLGEHQKPTINVAAFPTTLVKNVWTSSINPSNSDLVYFINFINGFEYYDKKFNENAVRLVSGNSINGDSPRRAH